MIMATTLVLTDSKEWTHEQQQQELTRRLNLPGLTPKEFEVMPPFTPRADDVVCAVPYKSGTTWLTHICHQIRMQGAEPTFEDQTTVVCWIEWNKAWHGVEPDDVTQPAEPRIFATHLSDYSIIPKANRIIYCFRDQMDALYSLYRMMDSLLLLKGRIPLALFATSVEDGSVRKSIEQLLGWWKRRHQEDVLLMFYDDLKEDHTGCVRKIAKFMGVSCTDEVIARVVKTTSHAEMSKHSTKFILARSFCMLIAQKIGEEVPDLDAEDYVGRVRKDGGRSGDGKLLPQQIQEYYDQQWKEIITAELGFNNLKEMRDAWHKEQEL